VLTCGVVGDGASEETQAKKKGSDNKSKRRHLYQNRLASRDASNYSKEDMALILGTQKMTPSEDKIEEEEEVFSDSDDESLMLTKQTVSVTDYFLRKGATKTAESDHEDDEADARPSFAAPTHDLTDFCGIGHKRARESIPEESEVAAPPSKKDKKEKREKKKKDRKERKKAKKRAKAMAAEEGEGKKSKRSSKKSTSKKDKSFKSEPEAKRRKKSKSWSTVTPCSPTTCNK